MATTDLTPTDSSAGQSCAGSWQIGSAIDGWWAREREEFLAERLELALHRARRVVDVGCGFGGFDNRMANQTSGFVVACDFEPYPTWKNQPGRLSYVACDATQLPFRSGVFDLAIALDVIEHFADDDAPLKEIARVAQQAGSVGITVPALPTLWSAYDESVGHHRRYRARDLDAACRRNGLVPSDITYFFAWLVPPAWLLRRRNRLEADRPREGVIGRLVERCLAGICRLERAWLKRFRLPLGTSLWTLSSADPAIDQARSGMRHSQVPVA